MSSAAVDPQDGLFDRTVDDQAFVDALEEREKRNKSRKATAAKYRDAHDKVKAMLDEFALGDDEVVRCGRFRIKMSRSDGRSVSFETGPTRRISISLFDE